jgi:hypothetical protein
MAKRIIVVHGRSVKPARAPMEGLVRQAIAEGFRRNGDEAGAKKIETGKVRIDLAYFGDISNAILAQSRKKYRDILTETDPDTGVKTFPFADLSADFEENRAGPAFTPSRYEAVLKSADDWRFLDEAADFTSMIGTVLTGGLLNQLMISAATPDMAAYLTSHDTASAVRQRLRDILMPALSKGDDICLVAHSMGAMVSYDLMWKFAHESEYEALRAKGNKVSLFLTIGCPLGEPGVRRSLLDGRYLSDKEKYPRNQIRDWLNIHAEDDYIARAEKMAPPFRRMVKDKAIGSIKDRHIYNCWIYRDKKTGRSISNPHDLYGYLMHQDVGKAIGGWAG